MTAISPEQNTRFNVLTGLHTVKMSLLFLICCLAFSSNDTLVLNFGQRHFSRGSKLLATFLSFTSWASCDVCFTTCACFSLSAVAVATVSCITTCTVWLLLLFMNFFLCFFKIIFCLSAIANKSHVKLSVCRWNKTQLLLHIRNFLAVKSSLGAGRNQQRCQVRAGVVTTSFFGQCHSLPFLFF